MRSKHKHLILIGLGVAVALTLLAVFVLIPHLRDRIAVESALEDLLAAGYPTDSASLRAWYPAPDEAHDASVHYAEAIDAVLKMVDAYVDMEPLPVMDFMLQPEHAPLDEASIVRSRAFLRDYVHVTEALMRPPADGNFVFPIRPDAIGYDERYYLMVGWGATYLSLYSLIASIDGDAEAVVNAATHTAALYPLLRPSIGDAFEIIMPHTVRRELMKQLRRALQRVRFTDEQLQMIDAAIGRVLVEESRSRRMVPLLCQALEDATSDRQRAKCMTIVPIILDPAMTVAEADRIIQDAKDGTPKDDQVVGNLLFEAARVNRSWRPVSELMLIRVAAAIERFRLARGRLPERLDELVPDWIEAVPVDPYSPQGASVRYARSPVDYLVYSLGRNRVDDRGDDEEDDVVRIRLKPGE